MYTAPEMAKFLDTTGVSYHLQQLINKASDKLILVSPYLRVNERLKSALTDREAFKVNIRIVYGKSELLPEESEWLSGARSIRLSFFKNLHAKCYISESEAIVTSMNLYEFSQVNNAEMGIYVSKQDDPQLYNDISEEVARIVRASEEVQVSIERVRPKEAAIPTSPKSKQENVASGGAGHCISCNDAIKLAPQYPFCRSCFQDWDGDEEEPQSYCHVCGQEHATTKLKPSCYPCFKANRSKLDWAIS